ncbi:helicase-related protein [Elioraea tepidiphila]|uniref:helicase-related protein n=1 Tax=Elioraea tepidiphila TaxID=457934 RepID=UPI0038D1B35C
MDTFQAGANGFDAMILSPRARVVGLTLTAATHVIHLSRWWNPAVEDQCTDRAYRIGQTSPVTVHLLLAVLSGREEDSFDRRLDELLARKRHLSRELLHPPAGTDADRDELFESVIG